MNIKGQLESVRNPPWNGDETPEFVDLGTQGLISERDGSIRTSPACHGGEGRIRTERADGPLAEYHGLLDWVPHEFSGVDTAGGCPYIFSNAEVDVIVP